MRVVEIRLRWRRRRPSSRRFSKGGEGDPAALMLAGRIATIAQQPAVAALHYRAVLAISPNNSEAALGLGNALTALNDVAGADAAFARYREIIGLAPR